LQLPTFADLLATQCQDVANKLATSRCNGIWETTQQTQGTFARASLLRESCGETVGVVDFGLNTDALS